MQTDNRLIDDLAKVGSGALGVLAGVKDEFEARLRQRLERVLDDMELVGRDEFDAVKAMAAEARAENERMAKRLAAPEAAEGRRRKTARKPASAPRKGADG